MWAVAKMVRRPQIHPQIATFYNLLHRFCDAAESPELPDWLNFPTGEHSCTSDSEDDFVLPAEPESFEIRAGGSSKGVDRGVGLETATREIPDNDVDEISRLLNKRFASPDAVVLALDSLSVEISKSLVDRILVRFGNDWIPAFGFFKWAKRRIGYGHSVESYNMMVDILGKSKQFDAMWELVEEMVRLGGLVSLNTMTKVMRRLAGAGRWGDAIRTFRDLESFSVKRDTMAMNMLLDTLCKERSVKHARDAFVELRTKISPNASSFNCLIHGWCQARQAEEAWKTMEEMRGYGFEPCVITYTSLVEAYCAKKNFENVDVVLDEMRAKGCGPNVVTYTIVMHSLGKAKRIEEALQVLEKMKRDDCTPDTSFFNSLIYILGRAGRLCDANDVYEEMCKKGLSPNATTYNTLISTACDHSQEENALKLLRRMEEGCCKPDIKTYSPLLKLCCKKGWMKILLYLLADMLKKDVSIDLGTYSLIIHRLCRNGNLEYSCLFFEEMVMKGFIPKHHTYTILLKELERKNLDRRKEEVQQLMLRAQKMKKCDHHLS